MHQIPTHANWRYWFSRRADQWDEAGGADRSAAARSVVLRGLQSWWIRRLRSNAVMVVRHDVAEAFRRYSPLRLCHIVFLSLIFNPLRQSGSGLPPPSPHRASLGAMSNTAATDIFLDSFLHRNSDRTIQIRCSNSRLPTGNGQVVYERSLYDR